MNEKVAVPKWILIVAGLFVVWVYSTLTSQPVSSLSASTRETHSVYAGPNVNYGEIGQIKANTRISITGRYGDSWVTFNYNGQQGWIQDFFLEIDGNISRLPKVSYEPIPTPTKSISKEQVIQTFLQSLINDVRYDSSSSVLHKYVDFLDVKISGSVLTYTLWNTPETPDEFVMLAGDLVFASALVSHAGESSDWQLSKVELYSLGAQNSYAALFVSGHENIVAIAQNKVNVYDILQTDVSYGTGQQPSNSNNSESCNCSYNAYDCSDFSSQQESQACFNDCMSKVGSDIHWLDDDGDGQACEYNP
jgi:uncharacterized protein YraI